MLEWFFKRIRHRAEIRMEADSLLSVHGDGAWEIAYGRCKDMALPDPERQRFLAVRREIERRLGMESHQQDTATRYLKQ